MFILRCPQGSFKLENHHTKWNTSFISLYFVRTHMQICINICFLLATKGQGGIWIFDKMKNILWPWSHEISSFRYYEFHRCLKRSLAPWYLLIGHPTHYSDVIRMQWHLKLPASRLFTQPFIQAQIKENIKAPRHWPLRGEITGDRWIPRTKGQ